MDCVVVRVARVFRMLISKNWLIIYFVLMYLKYQKRNITFSSVVPVCY